MDAFKVKYTTMDKILYILQFLSVIVAMEGILLMMVIFAKNPLMSL